uniref:Uncharacterized protein n=1 Tax=Octopus bimaculoides TaxID=37653 RepID=A0A0L8HIH7_OCTBM
MARAVIFLPLTKLGKKQKTCNHTTCRLAPAETTTQLSLGLLNQYIITTACHHHHHHHHHHQQQQQQQQQQHYYTSEISVEAILIKIQLRWSGQLSCMSDIRIPKQLLFGQLSTGRSVGRPLLRFKNKLKDNLRRCSIPFSCWENKASECRTWCQSCFSSVQRAEQITWKITLKVANRLDTFHQQCLQKIFKVTWQERNHK